MKMLSRFHPNHNIGIKVANAQYCGTILMFMHNN